MELEKEVLAITSSLQRSNLNSAKNYSLVDTSEGVASLINALSSLPTNPPSIYVDLEGVKLSRHGTISIIQFFVRPTNHTYLLDICTLGADAFLIRGPKGQSLKDILESDAIPKAFFDVRNDSDALYSHFGINLAGVWDIQLMELATRRFRKKFVMGLSKCIERDLVMTAEEKQTWTLAKEKGLQMFLPEKGGSYEVFNTRPLAAEIIKYCVQDVRYLPRLWQMYHAKLDRKWAVELEKETKKRVALSKTESYLSHGKHKVLGPWA